MKGWTPEPLRSVCGNEHALVIEKLKRENILLQYYMRIRFLLNARKGSAMLGSSTLKAKNINLKEDYSI